MPDELAVEVWQSLSGWFMRHRERMQAMLQELGLSFGDMRALLVLDTDTPRPMRSLAESWACDASNATWMVDRLEQRGLVERRMLPSDRRVKAVVLTGAGAAAKAELQARLAEPPPDLLALGPADLEVLRLVLGKLHSPAGGASVTQVRSPT